MIFVKTKYPRAIPLSPPHTTLTSLQSSLESLIFTCQHISLRFITNSVCVHENPKGCYLKYIFAKNCELRPVSLTDYHKLTCSALACTSLQLSHPKYQLWAARNVTCLPFSFLFSGHQNKNHSAQTWGLGCFYLDYSQPGWFCGLQPTDHPLRPGSHQWTHSIALSLFRWPEQLILSKNE